MGLTGVKEGFKLHIFAIYLSNNSACFQPYDKFSMSNWPSVIGAPMYVHWRPADPIHDDWDTILPKDNLAHNIPFSS